MLLRKIYNACVDGKRDKAKRDDIVVIDKRYMLPIRWFTLTPQKKRTLCVLSNVLPNSYPITRRRRCVLLTYIFIASVKQCSQNFKTHHLYFMRHFVTHRVTGGAIGNIKLTKPVKETVRTISVLTWNVNLSHLCFNRKADYGKFRYITRTSLARLLYIFTISKFVN